MRRRIQIIASCFLGLAACSGPKKGGEEALYKSKEFAVYPDRVEQGEFEAKAVTPDEIRSDYVSPSIDLRTRLLAFKFAINGVDNEAAPGEDHKFLIPKDGDNASDAPVFVFGKLSEKEKTLIAPMQKDLKPNTPIVLKLDMRGVLESFEKKGYYETYDGRKIKKKDFKGVYVAGNIAPLDWDFNDLQGKKDRMLTDKNGDGIYELALTMNPQSERPAERVWTPHNDISKFPQYKSEQPLVDALYNLSLDETVMDTEADGTFRTGKEWAGVWTRDVSYSILLSYAMIEPRVAKTSLMRKVKRGRIIQDTGSGGAWPVSTDRTTWALAAYEVYKSTGDRGWLKESYDIIRKSVADDEKVIVGESGLRRGESSFLDWREQEYPLWMQGTDIYESECLGTNAVHFRTYEILAEMAVLLGEKPDAYRTQAKIIKQAINDKLWLADKNYYGIYRYGREYMSLEPRSESLGAAFAVMFGIADADRAKQVVENTPMVPYGAPCLYPQIPGIPPYHNNGIWPFVQAYWNWAAAETGNYTALEHGLASIYRPAALFLTNKENFVAQNGDYKDTQINSDRQLWSVAGNLAMVYRVFYGMRLEPTKLSFRPVVPEAYAGRRELKGFPYRRAVLDITMTGYGNTIKSFKLDGKEVEAAEIPAHLRGKHKVEIVLDGVITAKGKENLVPNEFSPFAPKVTYANGKLSWKAVEGAVAYELFKDGEPVKKVKGTSVAVDAPARDLAQYQVRTHGAKGFVSFLSAPIDVVAKGGVEIYQAESVAKRSKEHYKGYTGKGFVELTKEKHRKVTFKVRVPESGRYRVDFRYSNGSGPINTENKCAIRSLFVDKDLAGAVVMPQMGVGSWSEWHFSNGVVVDLKKGSHKLSLRFESWNENMNVDINTAMLDYLRLTTMK
ncbi:hypothetical protein FUAX_29010 [Fulvitalea axinellae]|uniref:Alpha-L-rhamnosidase six-hairpin glycosidase domain-containing protein n=1 Tax=Fulvitalea axinellae TaxID=1182444 RepID=A0AAU9CE83_9BACT|nr:hypothetical protein FUAX_29010 [Fulvitalea axinellae]